ncbi:MAG TPA: VWA domain-containing protein [Bdellovibrionota bacterium]|jgi:Ca-activated chloride channel family protein|nr:VWA domain-containing protein [Bdellovibrionota bacterium]
MTFANPEVFAALPLLLLVAFFTYRYGVRYRSRLYFPTDEWVDKRPRFTYPTPFKVHFFLRFMALALIILALARPQIVFTKEKRSVDAVDMIVAFDLSKSMLALDFRPNRREVAIQTINQFIDARKDDRIGLVLFSGEAYLGVPLTQDHDTLKTAVINSSNRFIQDGTAIGQAIALSVHHLQHSFAKSKILILVTDGDNNMGSVDPKTAAALAKAYGIKTYTIALGKEGRVMFPDEFVDAFGNRHQQLRELTNALNENLLREIATMTGGRFYRAGDGNILKQIFDNIDSLEKTRVETQTFTRATEEAWPWILAALVLLLIEGILLNTRWRKLP